MKLLSCRRAPDAKRGCPPATVGPRLAVRLQSASRAIHVSAESRDTSHSLGQFWTVLDNFGQSWDSLHVGQIGDVIQALGQFWIGGRGERRALFT